MKKFTILLSILLIIGMLAACGTNADQVSVMDQSETTSQQEPTAQSGATQDGTPPEFEVPLQTALIIGTFELEGTENEVTTEQAAELLPLWMVLKNLLESDTAATAEIDALTNQISETMTDAQMEQINYMELTGQSMRMMMDELGLNEGLQRPEGAEGEEGVQRGANRPEGMPAGTGPGGGEGGTGLTPEQIEAMQATREAGGGTMGGRLGMMGNTMLIDALIDLLHSK